MRYINYKKNLDRLIKIIAGRLDRLYQVKYKPFQPIGNIETRVTKKSDSENTSPGFKIEIRGTLNIEKGNSLIAKIKITDSPDTHQQLPAKQINTNDNTNSDFLTIANLGTVPHQPFVISQWLSIADIDHANFLLPYKGTRNLGFTVTILSQENQSVIAKSRCLTEYENPRLGYVDENKYKIQACQLAVTCALAVASMKTSVTEKQINDLLRWQWQKIEKKHHTKTTKHAISKALAHAAKVFALNPETDYHGICQKLTDAASPQMHVDTVKLCIETAASSDKINPLALTKINDIAFWLDIDFNLYRQMVEDYLTLDSIDPENASAITGLSEHMSLSEKQRLLKNEYRKWHCRATLTDPNVQKNAEKMLLLISNLKNSLQNNCLKQPNTCCC